MNRATGYLVLAVLGAVIPVTFFVSYEMAAGIIPVGFVKVFFENAAARGFTADLLISLFAFWIYIFSKKGEGPKSLTFIL